MSTRPVVGVVGHGHLVPRPFGDLPVTGTPPTYLDAVAAAGGRPVVLAIPYAVEQLDLVDAIVLTGGGDVDPRRHPGRVDTVRDVDPARDEAELALVHAAAAARIPLLGICRGLQIMAVAFGGALGAVEHELVETGHDIRTAPGSLVRTLLGTGCRTSALHRQAITASGEWWRPTAWADDATVEAIEPVDPDWPALGVQWHPELGDHPVLGDGTGPALFGWLVEHAGNPSTRRETFHGNHSSPRFHA